MPSFIAREGYPFIFSALFLAIIFYLLSYAVPDKWTIFFRFLSFTIFLLAIFITFFFRDPVRIPPESPPFSLFSPADGTVIDICETAEPRYLKTSTIRVSIFMSLFDVHINRSPLSGTIDFVHYHPGKFFSAFKEKASTDNESLLVGIRDEKSSQRVAVKFIAGLIARRIVFYKGLHQKVKQGEKINMIRFGSRVEIYCPATTELNITKGDRVKAGKTLLGTFKDR